MSDAMSRLIDRARWDALRRRVERAVVVGGVMTAAVMVSLTLTLGPPRSLVALIAIPVALAVVRLRRGPSDFAVARSLDERFATGDLFATAMHVDGDAIGQAILAQASVAADRLADVDLAADRPAARRRLAAAGVAVAASLTLSAILSPAGLATDRSSVAAALNASDATEASAIGRSDEANASSRSARREDLESTDASRVTAKSNAAARDAGRSPAGGIGASQSLATIDPPPAARSDAAVASTGSTGRGDGVERRDATAGVVATGTAARTLIEIDARMSADAETIAHDAIDAGRVPAASRALVRAFFDPGDAAR